MSRNTEGLKRQVLTKLFAICEERGDYTFDNTLVKEVCSEIGFGNPFDVTKVDRKDLLPKVMLEKNFAVIHLGNGSHRFIEGVDTVSHDFEPIQQEIDWKYHKSVLNEYNTSESNILSVANNQRILHHFTFNQDREFEDVDIMKRPKTYFPHRTKANLKYKFGDAIEIELNRMQIEIDLTIEFEGTIAVFEAKNGKPDNFSIYQIYHPFLYYHEAKKKAEMKDKIKDIVCVYVVKQKQRDITKLSLWKYTFDQPEDITSIKFLKSACYNLTKEDEQRTLFQPSFQ